MKKEDLILIIGAGLFQLKAIREAQALGLKVLALDLNPDAPGAKVADYFEAVSTRDISRAIECAKLYATHHRLRGVFTAGTDMSYTVACIAEELKLPGIPPETALAATNKFTMRLVLSEFNVPVPKFRQAKSLEEACRLALEIGFPLVIKPVDNMGARGVRRLDSIKDLQEQFAESLSFSGNFSNPAVILERFLEGPEISMDTLVFDGKVHCLTIADRHIGYPPYFVEYGHSIPSLLPKEKLTQAFEVMQKAIRAIGITLGAAKADIKITEDGAYIGEITARLSGGFHSQFTEHLATGMNSTRAAIKLCMGENVEPQTIRPQWERTAIERALILNPGEITSISGVEKALQTPGLCEIIFNKKEGDRIEPVKSNLGKVANLIAVGANRQVAEASVEKALQKLRVVTSRNQTESFFSAGTLKKEKFQS